MATLVLNAVGQKIGGPIGGAIGSLVGQRIDQTIFGGKVREGPRLTELDIQLSSYGSEIPAIFGVMRVAGTVIWATDLIERRTKSGGKGRPSTGGRGGVGNTIIGLLVLGVVNNGLDHIQMDSFQKILIRGLILLAALVINVYAQLLREKQSALE